MKRRCPRMCSSRLWICEACEKPASCLCTDWVENSPADIRPETLKTHRAVIGEQRMERVVADPRFVPQHVVAELADPLHDLTHVVDGAVVCRELDAREAERPCDFRALGSVTSGFLRICSRREPSSQRVPVDRADHAERVARSRQEDRNGAGLNQRALMQRLVIVAVEQHEVAAAQRCVGDDLVRGRRAVQHEVGAVCAEYAAQRAAARRRLRRRGSADRRDRRRRCRGRCGRSVRRSA